MNHIALHSRARIAALFNPTISDSPVIPRDLALYSLSTDPRRRLQSEVASVVSAQLTLRKSTSPKYL